MALESYVTHIKDSQLPGSVTHRDEFKDTQLDNQVICQLFASLLWDFFLSLYLLCSVSDGGWGAPPAFCFRWHLGSGCHQSAFPSVAWAPAGHHHYGSSSCQMALASGLELHHLLPGFVQPGGRSPLPVVVNLYVASAPTLGFSTFPSFM